MGLLRFARATAHAQDDTAALMRWGIRRVDPDGLVESRHRFVQPVQPRQTEADRVQAGPPLRGQCTGALKFAERFVVAALALEPERAGAVERQVDQTLGKRGI